MGYTGFIPAVLPPEPAVNLEGDRGLLLSRADQSPGAIYTIATILPNPGLFVAMFIQNDVKQTGRSEESYFSLAYAATHALALLDELIDIIVELSDLVKTSASVSQDFGTGLQ